ncbi:formin-like protein 14 isoform X2 [Herrania umbratica]|uniref:Formin-like protein 14 isoform X2 n=1 Tax=Herrania umbratica TaxID=108875 RepID=A0A6J1B2U4_9ROSI|nr:formin-like protein 14 isoform X2 [Herrania umbratica]
MSYHHQHIFHEPQPASGHSPPYPPPGIPPPPPPLGYTHTHHSPSPSTLPGYQGYFHEGYTPSSPPPPPPPLPTRNDYHHNGCSSFLTGWEKVRASRRF